MLDLKQIKQSYPMISIEFKEQKENSYKVVGMYAKRARGMMVRHVLQNQIQTLEEIKHFNEDGYRFNEELSDNLTWVFTR